MRYEVNTLRKREDLKDKVASLDDRSWPVFLQNGDAKSWAHFYDELSDYVLVFTQNDELIAAGFTVPVNWDSTPDNLPNSIESVLRNGLSCKLGNSEQANTLIPIGALVDKKYQGLGLSSEILKEMKKLAFSLGLSNVVVPVRPTKKAMYPLQPIKDYAQWRTEDGQLYDPWLRVHEKLGAEVIKIADNTLEVRASLSKWSEWTGMMFPASGTYVVKGALSGVVVDYEHKEAVYQEPNVWMLHPMGED